MADSDSDEDLKRAIALSLQQSPSNPAQNPTVIDLVSDDDDDSLDAPQRVIPPDKSLRIDIRPKIPPFNDGPKGELNQHIAKSGTSSIISPTMNTNSQKSVSPSGFGLLGIDRKTMEAERLARAAQRGKEQVEKVGTEPRKRKGSHSLYEAASGAPLSEAKKPRPSQIKDVSRSGQKNHSTGTSISSPSTLAKSSIQYPKGVVKRTYAKGFPRQDDDISIEEVFQREDLQYAILSGFQVDPEWIQKKLEPQTRVVWVLQAKNNAEKQRWQEGADKDYRFCFPQMNANITCMHSKLQLLVHPSHIRIAVPSGNLTSYDWGETGVVENVCFLIDLPRLPQGQETSHDQLTPFGRELYRFVDAMGLDKKLVQGLRKFDFSQTKHLGFVHTIGGSHDGETLRHTGYCGLANCVQELGLHTSKPLEIDFVTGSIGAISDKFIHHLALAAQGVDGVDEVEKGIDKSSKSKSVDTTDKQLSDDLQSRCRIYFPTRETVANTIGGIKAGGTICFEPRWYESTSFPRSLMRDCESTRKRLLIHSKMWFVRPMKADLESRTWAYVGSSNLSESAWGRLHKDKATKKAKLNCRNWECGVIFPIPASNVTGMEAFRGHAPVPVVIPGKRYDGARPWFSKEQ